MDRVSSEGAQARSLGASLGEALFDRGLMLLLVLGFATGFPVGWGLYNLSEMLGWIGGDRDLTRGVFPTWSLVTSWTLFGVATFWLAPFLDRGAAPWFSRLGHRRSWIATTLAVALALLIASIALTFMGGSGAAPTLLFLHGAIVLLVAAPMMITIDAFRIEVWPGRAQALAFGTQFLGSTVAGALVPTVAKANVPLLLIAAVAVQLVVGLVALWLIREPEPPRVAVNPIARSEFAQSIWIVAPFEWAWQALTQPWRVFFARHSRAAPLLLAAIAFYAAAGSGAEYLARDGYVNDLTHADPSKVDAIDAARTALASFEILLQLFGALIAALAAFALRPARAFNLMQWLIIALALLFVLCKLASGFTGGAVVLLTALKYMLTGAEYVIYAVVAARLTARPYTAGQFFLLAVFVNLFWLGDHTWRSLIAEWESHVTAIIVAILALAAIACMRIAGRLALRPNPTRSRESSALVG